MDQRLSVKALILAGGLGTRLRPIADDVPKPMVRIHGQPFLEYQLEFLKQNGIRDILLSVGYLGEKVVDHFGDGTSLGLRLSYVREESPQGTAGAIRRASSDLDSTTIILNGDTYYTFTVQECIARHVQRGSDFSLIGCRRESSDDVGAFTIDEQGDIVSYEEKPPADQACIASCGAYFMEPSVVRKFPERLPLSLENDVIPHFLESGERISAILVDDDFFDIGTPERYQRFVDYIAGRGGSE